MPPFSIRLASICIDHRLLSSPVKKKHTHGLQYQLPWLACDSIFGRTWNDLPSFTPLRLTVSYLPASPCILVHLNGIGVTAPYMHLKSMSLRSVALHSVDANFKLSFHALLSYHWRKEKPRPHYKLLFSLKFLNFVETKKKDKPLWVTVTKNIIRKCRIWGI